jgi:hypothetical protein
MTKQFDLNLESATSRSKLAVAAFFSRSTQTDSHDLRFSVGKQPPTFLLQRPNHKKQLDQQKFAVINPVI